MTSEQHSELLEFLYSNSPAETLYDCSFRILCFAYEDRKLKDWIQFEQQETDPSWTTLLVFPTIGMKFSYLRTVGEVISFIEGMKIEDR